MKLLTIGILAIYAVLSAAEVSRVSPKLAELVPTINQENYMLMPIDDTFNLSLDAPEGGYRKEETKLLIDENGNKVLAVKGRLNLFYDDAPFNVIVIYEADGKGYRAKYMYVPKLANKAVFASASLLKSAAG
ncbi:uncharacterized protein LOC120775965 isoform X3 [Bactrocera tryoni]|nr:uncharacterized protein LOC120775965 isoform X3 [Bactrocera tryoni]XP_039962314.1 uncharacterized protein LOC120775965 isoform X3 [Bactrocera tryoni]XP_039962315.1 uncharacterized protein LOC120775965 isoform X3 [Bactrocera tryoni]